MNDPVAKITAEQLSAPCTAHGEGPLWDPAGDRLLLVDMIVGDIVTVDRAGHHNRTHVADVAACLRHRSRGGYILATERGFVTLDDQLRPTGPEIAAFTDTKIRMNDGGCDPQGRFYCGSMAYDETTGAGSLYRLDTDGSVAPVLDDVTISNGLQWTADGRRALYNDTPTGQVTVFDFDDDHGTFGDPRRFVAVDGPGAPDGMAIDTEDGIWVALWGGSAVRRYSSDGRLTAVIDLPVSNVTACTFGGPDLRTLYITTSRQGLADGEQPEAGAVFVAEPGFTGTTPYAYAG
ncbi:SMP-30/gluconolactonase/LRE family protein [Microlunatus soli]|uniref:Sugar lactone lactonase YvrE n=1 Tax=Microlunatus soli TaxID=630515 RepID=A0A1H1PRG7_9ACTN|nr:SMP-30/gluconolactonase/LRE family protein [Microlunatus soli]SDS13673.1 Sugar lactone lactonase YvrE [Microlunatus soli]